MSARGVRAACAALAALAPGLLGAALATDACADAPRDPIADALAAPDTRGSDSTAVSAPDSVGALGAPADSTAAGAPPDSAQAPPRPAAWSPFGPADSAAVDAEYRRSDGLARGSRTEVEPLRGLTGLYLERFGLLGQSERLTLLGEGNLGVRLAGVPLLPSRSGLAPLCVLPGESLRSARVRRPGFDLLLGGRGSAGSMDWGVSTVTDADAEPITTAFAERGDPFEFRSYRASFERWLGPLRAHAAYQSVGNRIVDSENYTRSRGSYLHLATAENAPLPLMLTVAGTRQELDLSLGLRELQPHERGTEERLVSVASTAVRAPGVGRVGVTLKDDRVEWRTAAGPTLRGRERESGVQLLAAGGGVASAAAWGYAGRIVDERLGTARGTERVGGSLALAGAGPIEWRLQGGAERVSPSPARENLGAGVACDAGPIRLEVRAHQTHDHPPRALLLDGADPRPARKRGVAAAIARADSTARLRWRLDLLRRWSDDAIFLGATTPFVADIARVSYRDWGAQLSGAARLPLQVEASGEYLFLEDDADAPLPLRARHRGKVHLQRAMPFFGRDTRLTLGAGAEFVGRRASIDRSSEVPAAVDVRAVARLHVKGAVLFAQGEDLLDRFEAVLTEQSAGEPTPFLVLPEGRIIYLGVTWYLQN